MSEAATTIQRAESSRALMARGLVSHAACLGVFWVPLTRGIFIATVIGYFMRVFFWEAGSHRYFAHRSYKTSRAFQALLAICAAAAGQRGPIWWAVRHRDHHRYSDTELDVHSPVTRSRWFSHYGWLLEQKTIDVDLAAAKDLSRYPELVWVNRYHYLLPFPVLVATFAAGQYTALFGAAGLGASAVVWAFFVSMVGGIHSTLCINSMTHGIGTGAFNSRRYATGDATTNCWPLAVLTMGAAWHNNHHRYMNAARAGFYWWEIDLAYLVLRALSLVGIVWDLQPVPEAVLAEGKARRAGA